MGWNDHSKEINYIVTCPDCKNKFKVLQVKQIPGYRNMEEQVCPYCNAIVKRSMEYDFYTEKYEERDK